MTLTTVSLPRSAGIALTELPPLSLYVHIPWCIRKCPYCDFNSHEAPDAVPEASYVDALIADLEGAIPSVWGRKVQTVFFGGGTPSLFTPQALDRFLSAARALLPIEPDAEITLEANPGTFEIAKFAEFRALGINRLSIGIQSFDRECLQRIGRVHDEREAFRAIEIATGIFDNFNVDLMYALPGQDLAVALCDIDCGIAGGATHVSAYHLTIEPNTYFHRYPPHVPDDDTAAEMQEQIEARLAQRGFDHYETSAFAKSGRQCKHNLNYWTFGDYLGIGAGAHSKLSLRDRIFRQMRCKHPREYMERVAAGAHIQTENDVSRSALPFEFMMNALRLVNGFEISLFTERTSLDLGAMAKPLAEAEARELLRRDHRRIEPTLRGRRFLNEALQLFL